MADECDDYMTFVDPDRSAYLCDVGLPGYVVGLAVTPTGEDEAWLVNGAVLGAPNAPNGDGDQAHEQLGPLPAHWRRRVAVAPYRCGRPRADGRPCRQHVGEAGRACAWHPERANTP